MRSLHVLVVDDEAAIRQVVANHVRACGHGVEHVGSGEAALERLEQGEFGICTACGNAISDERLNAVPYAALCRNCMK